MKKVIWLVALCIAMVACNEKPQKDETQQSGEVHPATANPISLYSDSIAQDSMRADLYLMRARAYLAAEQVSAAMIDINRSISLNPNDVDSYLMLADIYYMMGSETNVTATLNRAVEIDPFDARPLVKLGELNLLLGNFQLSYGYLDKALKLGTYNPKAYFVRGMFSIVAEKDTVNALKNFMLAYEQDDSFFDAAEQISRIYSVQQPPYALDFMRKTQRRFPEQVTARYELALYLQSHGEPEEALQHYDTLLMEQPDNYMVLFNKAYVNFVYLQDNETALELFDRTLEVNPNYLDALYNKGRVLERMGKYSDAMLLYKEVLKRQNDYQLAIDALNRVQNQAE